MVIEFAPLEDELGDVLEKAIQLAGLNEAGVAEQAGISAERLREAIDYRYDLTEAEIRRLAQVLHLREEGVLALSRGQYPHADIGGLPMCLYPLRMAHGIGVANAYVVADCGERSGLLFDTGTEGPALLRLWPKRIEKLEAIFLTHAESEHSGGLSDIYRRFGPVPVFGPGSVSRPEHPVVTLPDGATLRLGRYQVSVLSTPGHTECHTCYHVQDPALPAAPSLLVSGDMLFAGSVGAALFCRDRLRQNVRRLLETLPPATVVAPGHGPLTTLAVERCLNPFA